MLGAPNDDRRRDVGPRSRRGIAFVDRLADHHGRPALIGSDGVLTYSDLDRAVDAVAGELGTRPSLVAVEMTNRAESVVAYLAALRGRHPVLLRPPGPAFDEVLRTYRPDVEVSADTDWRPVRSRSSSGHDLHRDLALLLSTSGSTGSPKLVRLSHDNVGSNASAIASFLGLSSDDTAITLLPSHYCYGLSVINSHLDVGATVVLSDRSVVDDELWVAARRHGVTSMAGVPHTFDLLDRIGFDGSMLPTLRTLTQAGGRMDPATVRRYAEMGRRSGWRLFVMYGQTEATARMAYLPPELAESRPESVGIAIPGGELTVAEDLASSSSPPQPDLGRGGASAVEGELVYRGPNVMLGYAEGPEDLALGATISELRTGDRARIDGDGLVTIVGRSSRSAKLFGLRIDLDRVEQQIVAAHGPALCAADDRGIVIAVRHDDPSADEVLSTIAHGVAAELGVPRRAVTVIGLPELPTLASGKYDRVALLEARPCRTERDEVRRAGSEGPAVDGGSVRALLADVLSVPVASVSMTDSFVDLGGDSLSYVEMSIRLEDLLGALPADWHTMSVDSLTSQVPSASSTAGQPAKRSLMASVETGVFVRAVAIVMIVGSHCELWSLPGGAHGLLAVAGFNYGRFQFRARTPWPGLARLAAPAMAWIAVAAMTTDTFSWPHALLVHEQFGEAGRHFGYWYIEALVQMMLIGAVVLSIPWVGPMLRRVPSITAAAALAVGLGLRFDLVPDASPMDRISRPRDVLWLFAIGWLAAEVRTARQRIAVSSVIAVAVPGFFLEPGRGLVVAAVLLALVWVRCLRVPRAVIPVVAAVGSTSFAIYLSHWQVYPPLLRLGGPFVATGGSILAGLLLGLAASRLLALARSGARQRSRPDRQGESDRRRERLDRTASVARVDPAPASA